MSDLIHADMFDFVWKKCDTNWKLDSQQLSFNDLGFVLEGSANYQETLWLMGNRRSSRFMGISPNSYKNKPAARKLL